MVRSRRDPATRRRRVAGLIWGEFIGFTGLNALPEGVPGAGEQEVGWRLAVLNVPSERVMQRLGMERVGVSEHPEIEVGHPIRPHVAHRMEEGHEKAL